MDKDKQALRDALSPLTSQPECGTCRLCEENVGLVYLIGDEAPEASRRELPVMTTSQGVKYLGRKYTNDAGEEITPEQARNSSAHRWCSQFDSSSNTCKIYAERPLCCRIYPLDLMAIDQEVWWVIHSECPISQRFQRERRMSVLAAMTVSLERLFTQEQLDHLLKQDGTSQKHEAFFTDESKVTKLRRYGAPAMFSLESDACVVT
jgi:Fe-S-cluster containining protein